MPNSPLIFGPNNTANNLQSAILQSNGTLLQNSGAKNYVTYNNFENGLTTGWGLGTTGTLTNGIPTGSPTFGSGASGNLSISASTSNPIANLYSLALTSSAATTAGNMLHTDALTIDAADQAKVLTFSFYYSVPSNPSNGNFSGTSSNSFGVACYDVTNSSWLPVAGNFSMTQNAGVGIATGTMQTNVTTASIRFVIYNANASAGAITLNFDRFYLGPQTAPIGPVVTDWQSWTPTGSWVSNTTYTGLKRQVGDTYQYQVRVATSGAPTSTVLVVNLQETIDTTKIFGSLFATPLGTVLYSDSDTTGFSGPVTYNSSTSVTPKTLTTGASFPSFGVCNQAAPFTFGAGDYLDLEFSVPIAGKSSNVQMSNDTDTRVVAASIHTTTPTSTFNSTSQLVTMSSATIDTHGSWNGTTTYTIPVSGIYEIKAQLTYTAVAGNVRVIVYQSGSPALQTLQATNSTLSTIGTEGLLSCKAGDTIQLYHNAPNGLAFNSDATINFLDIKRLSGPSVIAATESVNARYNSSSTSISSSFATVVYTSKTFDSHNAYNTSTGLYTVPVSGKYVVTGQTLVTATWTADQAIQMGVRKNSTDYGFALQRLSSSTSASRTILISDEIDCVAGDTLGIRLASEGTSPSISASAASNFVTFTRVGN